MLIEAAGELTIELKKSWMIGDRWRDVDCGAAAGCRTILIDYGYAEQLRAKPDFVTDTFQRAAAYILTSNSA